jgi:hypothetical protein
MLMSECLPAVAVEKLNVRGSSTQRYCSVAMVQGAHPFRIDSGERSSMRRAL